MRVDVLLATFNGEKYLNELLDSLWAQTHRDIMVHVRDDGSTDGTMRILERHRCSGRPIRHEVGPHLGAAGSYFALLSKARHDGAQIVALCDQDDVWLSDKIALGVQALNEASVPTLHCSRPIVTDESLRPLRLHPVPKRGVSFENALVENVATGSTIMLNAAALSVLADVNPRKAVMHDAWLYLLIAGVGRVSYSPKPTVYYRQHSHNAVGVAGTWRSWRRRVSRHMRHGDQRVLLAQATEFRDLCGDLLPASRRASLDRFISDARSPRSRLRYALFGDAYRQSKIDDIIFRALYAVGRI